jgi:hypothetical protein
MNSTTGLVLGLIVATIAGVAGFAAYSLNQPGQYDKFAACLEEKGAVFYGSYTCQHCATQKAMFGRSAKNLPYVECNLTDEAGNSVNSPVCEAEEITSYPTWKFTDGDVVTGVQSLEFLAEKTSCELPNS